MARPDPLCAYRALAAVLPPALAQRLLAHAVAIDDDPLAVLSDALSDHLDAIEHDPGVTAEIAARFGPGDALDAVLAAALS